ncbi:RidA family protein [Bradyrhizobium sp. Ai1a-2]|uniref:RidA family protein n=1 Tax=Bradyrhizobium sp. Ai1a-2 TaxID=196490 RepID=UPI000484AA2A|nr:RidA family protein [Bradyrhizobium sp. Ai1a-2]
MPRKTLQPAELFASRPWGFSQVVISEPGHVVNIAGQVAWNAEGKSNAEGLEGQFRQTLKQVIIAVEAAGGQAEDIQTLRLYIRNFVPGTDADIIAKVLVDVFGDVSPPASSWIGVQALAQPDYLIEVEAMAIVPID